MEIGITPTGLSVEPRAPLTEHDIELTTGIINNLSNRVLWI
jgi:hypothetical protein